METERGLSNEPRNNRGKMKSGWKDVQERNTIVQDKKRRVICLICPNCCELETEGTKVEGARCKRGEAFALQETVEPLRVLTTTLRYERAGEHKMVPVKTAAPVPLDQIFKIMKVVKKIRLAEIPTLGQRIRLEEMDRPIELIVTGE